MDETRSSDDERAGGERADRQRRGDDHLSITQLLLAGLGAASTGIELLDEVADDLAGRLGIDRQKVRDAVRDTASSWKSEAGRVGGRRDDALDRGLEKLGVVRRSEVDDLLLRVAQLEHRVRLLERGDVPAEAG